MLRTLNLLLVALMLCVSASYAAEPSQDATTVVHRTDMDFETVKENLTTAITGQGLLVSGTLHVSEMLHRTAADLGYDKNVYAKAESLEFCSAAMSHRMVRAHPANLTICPLTIGIYILDEDPDTVYVAYRRPVLAGGSAGEAQQSLAGLLAEIVAEAIE